MRMEILLVLGAATAAADTPPTLTKPQLTLLAKQGYKSPTLAFDSPALRVATAKKNGKGRLVIVTAKDKVVDAGATEPGQLEITAASHGAIAPPGLTQLEVSYTVPRANQGSSSTGSLWIVRDDGSIACVVSGSSRSSSGTACGSSGWTSATTKLTSAQGGGFTLDVKYGNSGNWSEPDGKGGCLNRSPVRSSHIERWLIPARGTCKKTTAPATTTADGPDF